MYGCRNHSYTDAGSAAKGCTLVLSSLSFSSDLLAAQCAVHSVAVMRSLSMHAFTHTSLYQLNEIWKSKLHIKKSAMSLPVYIHTCRPAGVYADFMRL